MIPSLDHDMLTTAEVADRLRCCRQTVRNLPRDGKIEAYRIGKGFFFKPSKVNKYLREHKIGYFQVNHHQ